MKVELAEISGSETYLHVYNAKFSLILQLSGILSYPIETPVNVYLPIHKLFVFDLNGLTIKVPEFDMEKL
jgi:glycerol transport system ATP-binding protein